MILKVGHQKNEQFWYKHPPVRIVTFNVKVKQKNNNF